MEISLLVGVLACNDLSKLAGPQSAPSGTADPSVYHNAAGALSLYRAALAVAEGGFVNGTLISSPLVFVAGKSGKMSDELQAENLACTGLSCQLNSDDSLDARQLPEGGTNETDEAYNRLQKVRGTANEAIGFLEAYDSAASPALRGHLYALQGYAELSLADVFCSGVPLSTLDFNGDYTYQPGATTAQMYLDAVAKFDTALMWSGDSVRFVNLARVGKGRAWLGVGQFDSAAAAVAQVPDGYVYQILVGWVSKTASYNGGNYSFSTIADQKGGTGLPYVSSNDPRTASIPSVVGSENILIAKKYGSAAGDTLPFTIADWIEARLIRAEAALQKGDVTAWLNQLNTLRATASVNGHTGTLGSLTDPGAGLHGAAADSARVTLLFRERAYWLFLTGQRQGDMRRLIRQYGRQPSQVFPFGNYPAITIGNYSFSFLTAPVPQAESANPKFHGCLSRGA